VAGAVFPGERQCQLGAEVVRGAESLRCDLRHSDQCEYQRHSRSAERRYNLYSVFLQRLGRRSQRRAKLYLFPTTLPNANGKCNCNCNANSHCHGYSYGNVHAYANRYSHAYANGYSYSHGYSYGNVHAYTNSYCCCYGHSYSHGNGNAYTHTDLYPATYTYTKV
jgi:hypothetical protein